MPTTQHAKDALLRPDLTWIETVAASARCAARLVRNVADGDPLDPLAVSVYERQWLTAADAAAGVAAIVAERQARIGDVAETLYLRLSEAERELDALDDLPDAIDEETDDPTAVVMALRSGLIRHLTTLRTQFDALSESVETLRERLA